MENGKYSKRGTEERMTCNAIKNEAGKDCNSSAASLLAIYVNSLSFPSDSLPFGNALSLFLSSRDLSSYTQTTEHNRQIERQATSIDNRGGRKF